MSAIVVNFVIGAALRGLDDYVLVPLLSGWARLGLVLCVIAAAGALVRVSSGASIRGTDGEEAGAAEKRTIVIMAFALLVGYGVATLLLATWTGYQKGA